MEIKCHIVPASFSTSISRGASAQPKVQPKVQTQAKEIVQKPFSSLGSLLHPHTLKAITEEPYQHVFMSPVQEKILEMMPKLVDTDEGKDLLVRAKTGTGKTLAFLVPGIERRVRTLEQLAGEKVGVEGGRGELVRIVNQLAKESVGVLVISPTRELATQIAVSATNLSTHHAQKGFGVQLLVGGESRGRQMRDWVEGRKDVVVGTPGRLRDLLENWDWEARGATRTSPLGLKDVFGRSGECVVVLDEGDTLLDMGFRSDVEAIVGHLKKGSVGKQTWIFSATVGKGVEGIVRETMRKGNWEYVDCVGRGEEKDVHAHVRQLHTVIGDGGGMGAFVHLLRLIVHDQLNVMKRNREGEKGVRSKMLVFFSTTKMTRLFAKMLRECRGRGMTFPFKKMQVYEMHSKKEMRERVRISKEFREKAVDEDEGVVMVTSDVSARGVDYPGVGRVVQMGVPGSREGYVHRVGRTGRGDVKEGRGDLVIAPWEMGFLKVLGDVGMEPVTVEGLKNEIEVLAQELEQGPGRVYKDLTKNVAKIEDMARSVANAGVGTRMQVLVDEDEYRAAWASLVGFYIGNGDALGAISVNDVIEGSGRWVEALGGLEQGTLAVGPNSGLPRGVLDRLRNDSERRGGKEKAWGSYSNSRTQDSRGNWKSKSPGGWSNNRGQSDRPSWSSRNQSEGNSRPSWSSRGEEGNSRPSWNNRNQSGGTGRPSWGSKGEEGNSRPSWSSNRTPQEGRSREDRFGGHEKPSEDEGERRGVRNRNKASWIGRGSNKAKRGGW